MIEENMKFDCEYLMLIHRIFIDKKPKKGGADIILDFLLENGKNVCLIEHSLEGNGDTKITLKNGRTDSKLIKIVQISAGVELFRWIKEIVFTVKFISKNFNQIPFCAAVDPLNVIQAVILKKLRRIKKIYFHCIDYSDDRFGNRILNSIYNKMYRFALNNSDICGVVSKPMMDCFSGIMKDKTRLYFMPNTRVYKERNIDYEKRNKYAIAIMSGRVDNKTNYENIFNVVARLSKEFPRIEFKIIAKIEDENYVNTLKSYVKRKELNRKVFFLGFFPEPADLEAVLINCGVGITSYSYDKVVYYMKFADSLKIREFASYGLPIVADSICNTAFEAEENNCGFVADSEKDIENALRKIWHDDNTYKIYSQNSLAWAKKNDKRKLLKELIDKIEDED